LRGTVPPALPLAFTAHLALENNNRQANTWDQRSKQTKTFNGCFGETTYFQD